MFKWNFFGRSVARLMVISMIMLPLHDLAAQTGSQDEISQAGAEAQQLAKDIVSGFNNTPSQIDGKIISLPTMQDGQTDMSNPIEINTNDLFPGTSSTNSEPMSTFFPDGIAPDLEQLKATYDSADNMDDIGNNSQSALWGDANSSKPSIQGTVFKVVQDMTNRSRPDLVNDPVLNVTKDIYANIDDLAEEFGDCTTETKILDSTLKSHIPDYKTCERVVDKSTDCAVNHVYDASVIKHHDGPFNLSQCGEDCMQVWIGHVGDNYWGGWCAIYESYTEVKVTNPDAVLSATLEYAQYDDYMQVWVGEPGSEIKVWSGPNGNFPPETGGACELSTNWVQNPNIDLTKYFKDVEKGSVVRFKIRVSVAGEGEGFGRIRIKYDPTKAIFIDEWHPAECIDAASGVYDGFADGEITCIDFPADAVGDNCTMIDGINVCSDDLKPSPLPGISNLCRKVQVVADYDFYKGSMECYTDAAGNEQCLENTGGNLDTCKSFEQSEQCGFISSKCVDGAGADSGNCYVFEEIWDCGVDIEVPNKSTETNYQCAGPVRCMGEDCLTTDRTQSQDFAEAVGVLNTAQFMSQDMNCVEADGTKDVTCEVFGGKPNSCKIAVGGIQDCCDVPTNTGLGTYVQMLFSVNSLDTAIMGLEEGSSLRSGYEVLREPVTGAFSEVTQPFTSYVENISGTVEGILEPITSFKDELVGELKEAVVDALNELFQETGSNMIAEAGGGAAAEGLAEQGAQEGASTAGEQILGNASAAAGYLMAAYTAYVVAVMVIQMIYKCEEKEFELAAKKEVKSCRHVGSYCASDILGACIEKVEAYCCYNSPLSRIINEQIRPQLNMGWGSPENPQCGGVPMEDIAKVDWTKVDLSEWLGILQVSGVMPGQEDINLDSITGSGHTLNIDDDRQNTQERTLARFDSSDVDQTRKDLADGMQFSVCPNGWNKVGDECQYVTVEIQEATKIPVYTCPSGYTKVGSTCHGPEWVYEDRQANYYGELLACSIIEHQNLSFDHSANQCIYSASYPYILGAWSDWVKWVPIYGLDWNWLMSFVGSYTSCDNPFILDDGSLSIYEFNEPYYRATTCVSNPSAGRTNSTVLVSGKDTCPSDKTCSVSNEAVDQTVEYFCPTGTQPYGDLCRKQVQSTVDATFVRYDYSCSVDWTLNGEQCEKRTVNTQIATGVN